MLWEPCVPGDGSGDVANGLVQAAHLAGPLVIAVVDPLQRGVQRAFVLCRQVEAMQADGDGLALFQGEAVFRQFLAREVLVGVQEEPGCILVAQGVPDFAGQRFSSTTIGSIKA